MKYEKFVKHVQLFAQLDSPEEAQRAIQATLETLGSRIYSNEAQDLASQLPKEVAQYLLGHEGENIKNFSLKEFYECVAQKEGVDGATAINHVRAVFSVLAQAVTPSQLAHVRTNLSPRCQDLYAPSAR